MSVLYTHSYPPLPLEVISNMLNKIKQLIKSFLFDWDSKEEPFCIVMTAIAFVNFCYGQVALAFLIMATAMLFAMPLNKGGSDE